MKTSAFSQGLVEFVELPGELSSSLHRILGQADPTLLDDFLLKYSNTSFKKNNLVFNYPRIQYAKLDRGEAPDPINASWFTLSNDNYTNPAAQLVLGETYRVATSTKAPDPANSKNSIIRFVLDVGQFTGSWKTALLIGGASANINPVSKRVA